MNPFAPKKKTTYMKLTRDGNISYYNGHSGHVTNIEDAMIVSQEYAKGYACILIDCGYEVEIVEA